MENEGPIFATMLLFFAIVFTTLTTATVNVYTNGTYTYPYYYYTFTSFNGDSIQTTVVVAFGDVIGYKGKYYEHNLKNIRPKDHKVVRVYIGSMPFQNVKIINLYFDYTAPPRTMIIDDHTVTRSAITMKTYDTIFSGIIPSSGLLILGFLFVVVGFFIGSNRDFETFSYSLIIAGTLGFYQLSLYF